MYSILVIICLNINKNPSARGAKKFQGHISLLPAPICTSLSTAMPSPDHVTEVERHNHKERVTKIDQNFLLIKTNLAKLESFIAVGSGKITGGLEE